MKPIFATHVDSDRLAQPSRQIPAEITAHKFLDNADRIFTQPGPTRDISFLARPPSTGASPESSFWSRCERPFSIAAKP
jgi:hypothetical protein